MSRIPFLEARFFDRSETRSALEERFELHLKSLRQRPRGSAIDPAAGNCDAALVPQVPDGCYLGTKDLLKLNRRAKRILELREKASGLSHLRKEDRERLENLEHGVKLITIATEHRADELAATLHDQMPWMAPATEVVWHAMRRSVREGWLGLRVPPLLLDGPPGIGKSHWSRLLGDLIGLPTTVVEATSENASFGLVGGQRGWGGAYPGRVIETVLQTGIANPVIVVDEVEKAGAVTSQKGHSFGLAESMLPLLEQMTATRWTCPYFQVRCDMSWIIWVLTSNDYRRLPEPLLNRCPPIRLRNLTAPELEGFIRRQGKARNLSSPAIEAILEALGHPSLRGHEPSLRVATRMLQRAADLEQMPMIH
ncbi:AAA family ATPase [Paracoccus sp. (in: a-proteobacteria)]|uniref:AAA family ATPase n=1 Tax=Paracoccus sp. TaxID=267 RepID=UPI00289EE7BD|nr:AAA family ATPase [Paracoccus sp. (in: a-proteobacteria)]